MKAESDLRLWYPHCDTSNLYRGDNGQDFERLRVMRKKRRKCPPVTGEFPTVKTDERPPFEFYSWAWGWKTPLTRKRYHAGDWVSHGGLFHPLTTRDPDKRRRLRSVLVREGGTVELRAFNSPTESEAVYAAVLHVRRWLLLLPLLLAALLVCLCLTFCGNPAAQDDGNGLAFLQGMTQTEGAKSEPVLSVEYASYSSTPDSTLQADRLAQYLTLSLPANCKDGGNPIASAPSIYIDLNHDGQFEASEIVYNPNGDLLKAGTEVSELEFTQAVPAGTYDALTRWDSVLSSDHSQAAGSATFKWSATFR